MANLKFKKGTRVIKLPLENPENALVIKITKADKDFAYGSDGNKYHQSNGRCSGRKVLDKKDTIQLPPFGFSADEEADRIRNIALRNKEIELEQLKHQEIEQKNTLVEAQKHAVNEFKLHKGIWDKARRIKTPLGTFKVIVIQYEGQYKGDIATCAMLVWIQGAKKQYKGYAAILMGIESELYNEVLPRHFTLEADGTKIAEVVGSLILQAKKNIS